MNYVIQILKDQKEALELVLGSLKGSEETKQNLTDVKQALQLLQTDVSSSCKHEHIKREDGLDECMDCGTKNY